MQSKLTSEIKAKMKQKKISQLDLSKKINVSREHLNSVLNNKRALTIAMMKEINYHLKD